MFKSKFSKRNFSLIELLIVIAIMGALAALILPSFSDSESASKDTVCDYNQAGTLRYLNMFKAANGVYPTGYHTGALDADAYSIMTSDNETYSADTDNSALTACATYNFDLASGTASAQDYEESLVGAGIVSLAYGQNVASVFAGNTGEDISFFTVNGSGGTTWTEEVDAVTGEVSSTGAPLTVRGFSLTDIAEYGISGSISTVDTDMTYTADQLEAFCGGADEPAYVVAPFFVSPTIDWSTYYVDGPNDSKISISMAGKCPWGEGGTARYYIAFFKVYETDEDGEAEPAVLLATSCPDCGILEADTF